MYNIEPILERIKTSVHQTAPGSTLILYGSFARGDAHKDSDIDLLILVDAEKIDWESSKKIKYPLYDIEFETGQIISPIIKSRKDWYQKYQATPLFKNISTDGIIL